jgi:hypothetical protein
VIGEGVVEQQDVWRRRRLDAVAGSLGQGLSLEFGQHSTAVNAEHALVETTTQPAVDDPVGQRRQSAAPLGGAPRLTERPCVKRCPMALPVVGEELALEPRDVHADRAFALHARHSRHRSSVS